MRPLQSEKHSIAWFKLAEFVSRGEKEKALGIYKLLALSLDDPAFINKLEGDILFAFRDFQAVDKYTKSATLYLKDGRIIEAASIFENLHILSPENEDFLIRLIDLYSSLNSKIKLIFSYKRLFLLYCKQFEFIKALELLEKAKFSTNEPLLDFHQDLLFHMIESGYKNHEIILNNLKNIIDGYILSSDPIHLQKFLSKLEVLNYSYYSEAVKLIKN